MRFCRFQRSDGRVAVGVWREGEVVPLENIDAALPTRIDQLMAIDDLQQRLAGAGEAAAIGAPVKLLAPVSRPEKVLCVGLNYRDHAVETGAAIPGEPVIFCKLPSALSGPDDPIILPPESDSVDYDAELVVVIGKTCRRVSQQEAMDYVFGYCCGHDVSARDWQKDKPGGQWLLGKSFDTFAPIGPYVVHASQVGDPSRLRVQMRINGQTMQDSDTSQFIFSVPEVISYISHVATLRPGDLIFTGTPPGVGAARRPPRFLAAGDVCEVEVEGLGVLTNPCVAFDSPEAEAARAATVAQA